MYRIHPTLQGNDQLGRRNNNCNYNNTNNKKSKKRKMLISGSTAAKKCPFILADMLVLCRSLYICKANLSYIILIQIISENRIESVTERSNTTFGLQLIQVSHETTFTLVDDSFMQRRQETVYLLHYENNSSSIF